MSQVLSIKLHNKERNTTFEMILTKVKIETICSLHQHVNNVLINVVTIDSDFSSQLSSR